MRAIELIYVYTPGTTEVERVATGDTTRYVVGVHYVGGPADGAYALCPDVATVDRVTSRVRATYPGATVLWLPTAQRERDAERAGTLDPATGCTPACTGHLGKFGSCLAEAVYELSMDGSYADGEAGDTEFGEYAALFILPTHTPVTIDPDGDARTVTVPAGNYVLTEAGSGAVDVTGHDTDAQARAALAEIEARYTAWLFNEE